MPINASIIFTISFFVDIVCIKQTTELHNSLFRKLPKWIVANFANSSLINVTTLSLADGAFEQLINNSRQQIAHHSSWRVQAKTADLHLQLKLKSHCPIQRWHYDFINAGDKQRKSFGFCTHTFSIWISRSGGAYMIYHPSSRWYRPWPHC